MPVFAKKNNLFIIFLILILCGFLYLNAHASVQGDVVKGRTHTYDQQELENLYQEGVRLFKQEKYYQARETFLEIERIKRAYKSTWSFIKRSEEHIGHQRNVREEVTKNAQRLRREEEEYLKNRDTRIEKKLQRAQKRERLRQEREERFAKQRALKEERRLEEKQRRMEKERRQVEKIARRKEIQEQKRFEKEQKRLEKERKRVLKEQEREEKLAKARALREQKEYQRMKQAEQRRKEQGEKLARALEEKKKEQLKRKLLAQEASREPEIKVKREEKVVAPRQDRQAQKKLMRRVKDEYRDVLALYKAGRYELAKDQILSLRTTIFGQSLPDSYREKMAQKLRSLSQKISVRQDKEEARRRRGDEKEQAQRIRQRKKETRHQEKREVKRIRQEQRQAKQKEAVFERQRQKAMERRTEQMAKQEERALKQQVKVEKKFRRNEELRIHRAERSLKKKKARMEQVIHKRKEEYGHSSKRMQRELQIGIDELYRDGLTSYKTGNYILARGLFVEVDRIWPNYKLTRHYLEIIEKDPRYHQQAKSKDREVKRPVQRRTELINEALDVFEMSYP